MKGFHDLVELAETSVARHADRPLFGERDGDHWKWMTYAEWQRDVDAVRARLASLGVGRGDKVAIISRNGSAWASAAYATYGLGAAFVPMYEAQRPYDWELILGDCGASVVICRTVAIAEAVGAMRTRLPEIRDILIVEVPRSDPRALFSDAPLPPIAAIHPAPDELAGLIYTSGTTGKPKGVMLTHRNLTSNAAATLATFPFVAEDRTVSFLPWAHVYGQVCELHILIGAGASTAFNTNPDHLLDDLREIKPTLLVAVPRVFNKLHAAVRAQIEHKPRLIRTLMWRGIALSTRRRRGEHLGLGERLLLWLAGFLFGTVRRKLGGRLRYAISGSATLSREVAEFVDALGIEVYEGYGLTETSPIVSFNRPGHRKLGSVGQVIEDVRIVIDESRGDAPGQGEIVVYGPNVMAGYHARLDENTRAFTPDGGLRTGDLGHVDADGYLFITGRIKEQYKLENGKYVMPTPLEEKLSLSPYISSVMVHGSGHPYNVALVVIDAARVNAWAREQHIDTFDITSDERVRALIQGELDRLSADFRPFERPRACVLTVTPFTVDNGLLTPTLKIKRRQVIERFGVALEALYDQPQPRPPVAPTILSAVPAH